MCDDFFHDIVIDDFADLPGDIIGIFRTFILHQRKGGIHGIYSMYMDTNS